MNDTQAQPLPEFQSKVTELTKVFQALAKDQENNTEALLYLLRHLEQTHRTIRENFLVPSLPTNRQGLTKVLREIEENEGWPYIEKMRLKAFLVHFDGSLQPKPEQEE